MAAVEVHLPCVTFVSIKFISFDKFFVPWQAVRDQRHVGGVFKLLDVLDRSSHSHVHHFDGQLAQSRFI